MTVQKKNMAFNLDDELFRWRNNEYDAFTLREGVRGTGIFGGTGSGKSSGSGAFIAHSYLTKGFGGIVLCAKIGEAAEWREYARLAGRMDDIVFFSPHEVFRFNPLLYEMSREDEGGKDTDVMTNMFIRLAKLGNRIRGGHGGGAKDPFWDLVLERITKAMLDISKLSGEAVTIQNMVKLLRCLLGSGDNWSKFELYCLQKDLMQEVRNGFLEQNEAANPEEKLSEAEIAALVESEVEPALYFKTFEQNYLIQCLYKIERSFLSEDDRQTYEVAKQTFLDDFPKLGEQLRSSITESFYAFANYFRSGLMARYCSSELSREIMPERTFEGKIVVVDFPVHRFGIIGSFTGATYKQKWQEASQRRKINKNSIPTFLWVDECQYFLDDADMMFSTTARSSKTCNVYITQNISNLYSVFKDRDKVHAFLGNLSTKIFHANDSYVTNEFASKTISNAKKTKTKGDIRQGRMVSVEEVYEPQVHPQDFISLANGSEVNDFIVEAYITKTGRPFSTGANYLKAKFKQRPKDV